MTRVPRNPITGKPLPRAVAEEGIPEFIEEDTRPGVAVPTVEELEDELSLISGGAYERDRRPL